MRFVHWLLDTGDWQEFEENIFVWANLIVGVCMLCIATAMFIVGHMRRKDLSTPGAVLVFILFCFCLGARRLLVFSLWQAGYYRILTTIDLVTAIVGLVALCYIPMVIRAGFKIPSLSLFKEVQHEKGLLEKKAELLTQVVEEKETIESQLVSEVHKKDAVIERLATPSVAFDEVIAQIDEEIKKVSNGN